MTGKTEVTQVYSVTDLCSMLALEVGRSPMIKEEDCSIALPYPVSDDYIDDGSAWMHPTPDMKTTALLPTIRVIGPIARLLKVLKLTEIPQDTVQVYDSHFEKVLDTFPGHHQIQNPEYLDPVEMIHLIYLQNARLALHRHNLKPDCGAQTRSRAVENCVYTASSTARLLRKCMQDVPSSKSLIGLDSRGAWEEPIKSSGSAFICTHVWRCTLFLLFRLDFEAASVCAKFSSILGNLRAVNTACGRYLDFFLAHLLQKLKQQTDPATDEELIAYVSGDLQGNYESSWVWQDDEEGLQRCKPLLKLPARTADDTGQKGIGEDVEWAGWDKIVRLIDGLAVEQQQSRGAHRAAPGVAQMPPIQLPPLVASPSPSTATTPRDRLSIKDLL